MKPLEVLAFSKKSESHITENITDVSKRCFMKLLRIIYKLENKTLELGTMFTIKLNKPKVKVFTHAIGCFHSRLLSFFF